MNFIENTRTTITVATARKRYGKEEGWIILKM